MTELMDNGPYHSKLNKAEGQILCGCGVYPLKTNIKGPAEQDDEGCLEGGKDILDEVLYYFKANMFFQQYNVKGPADRTLLYLTLYVHYVIKLLKDKSKDDSRKVFLEIKNNNFSHPGEKGFPLSGFLTPPKNDQEAEDWKAYMKQCREELNGRIVSEIYKNSEDKKVPDKFWTMFTKRKFLGKVLEK